MENENNLENNEVVENLTTNNNVDNEVYENVVIDDLNSTTLETIHTDLSTIICFIIFGIIVILCFYAYKFFDMFFKI